MDLQSLPDLSRRRLLAFLAGSAGAVAGGSYLLDGGPEPAAEAVEDDETSRRLTESYAPTLYFGERERWFSTDPRPYTSEQDGDTVVTGFDALDGYTAAMREQGDAPRTSDVLPGAPVSRLAVGLCPVLVLLGVRSVHDQLPLARLGSAARLRRPVGQRCWDG
jgi:hypothetical protein